MNDFFVYGAVIGFFAGLLFGYILRFIQDTKTINEINEIHEELEQKLIDGATKREEAYKKEINRLNTVIARRAAERIVSGGCCPRAQAQQEVYSGAVQGGNGRSQKPYRAGRRP